MNLLGLNLIGRKCRRNHRCNFQSVAKYAPTAKQFEGHNTRYDTRSEQTIQMVDWSTRNKHIVSD